MMQPLSILASAVLGIGCLAGCDNGDASRDTIRVVGSSTVLPFAKLVAENFARENSQFRTPIVEGNGTGGGMTLFCAGIGAQYPDVVDASRRMKRSEFAHCAEHGVRDIAEIEVGMDGIAFASAHGAAAMALTPLDVYKAIAATPFGLTNTARTWHDVNPALPETPILVYGPATISGTRDALNELILVKACDSNPAIRALREADRDRHDRLCTELRSDGTYADTADNYSLIVQKLEANPGAIGIFGYSYLESNSDRLDAIKMDGITPSYASIASGAYPGSRPLFIYVKKAHLGAIPGLREFVMQWSRSWQADGPLTRAGMIALPADRQALSAKAAKSLAALNPLTLD